MQFFDDVAHQIHVMISPCPVMSDGTGHPLIQGFLDHGDGQHSLLPLVDIPVFQHDPVPMKSIHDDINIFFFVVIADDGHSVTVGLDAVVEEAHFRRRHGVGVIGVGFDLFHRHGDYVIDGTFKLHNSSPRYFHIFSVWRRSVVAAPWSCQSPWYGRYDRSSGCSSTSVSSWGYPW